MRWTLGSWRLAVSRTTIRSASSKRTASTSSSIPREKIEQAIGRAVYELSCARPHEPDDRGFTNADFALYRLGYDYALVMVLKLLKVTIENWYAVRRVTRKKRVMKRAG